MKSSKGFLLLQELVYMCLAAILLTMAVSSLYRASAIMQQGRQLSECATAAQQAASGENYSGSVILTQSRLQKQGWTILEVQASYGKAQYTLIRAQAPAAGVSLAGAATGVYGGAIDADAGI